MTSTNTALDPNRIPIGVTAERTWLELRLTGIENPHVLIAGGSQTGKTTLLILIAMVAASRGIPVIILDPKLRFARAFRHPVTRETLPHVLVYRSADPDQAAQEWDGILRHVVRGMQSLYQEDEKSQVSILGDQTRHPNVLIVADELGTLLDFADADWQQRKPDGYKGKTPIRDHVHTITRMGAEARYVLVSANQTAMENELPAGTRTRTLCGQRIFLGPISEGTQWRMLAGDGVDRPEIPDGQKGAGAVIFGDGKPVRFQTAFIDWVNHPEKVYEIAAQGISILKKNGHITPDGRLRLGGAVVPPPGQAWLQVAGEPYGEGTDLPPEDFTPENADETGTDGDDDPDGNGSGTAAPKRPEVRMIVGNKAGAEFCGMTEANFRKHRAARPIPGQVDKYEGLRPAWPEPELTAWLEALAEVRRTERSA